MGEILETLVDHPSKFQAYLLEKPLSAFDVAGLEQSYILSIVEKVTLNFSQSTSRRTWYQDSGKITSVDPGDHVIPFHSESAFSPARPAVLWFYVVTLHEKQVGTSFLNGRQFWNEMPLGLKKTFLGKPLVFDSIIAMNAKGFQTLESDTIIEDEELFIAEDYESLKNRGWRDWIISDPGASRCMVDQKRGLLGMRYTTFATELNPSDGALYFCNHILSVRDEKQILQCRLDSEVVTDDLLGELNEIASRICFEPPRSTGAQLIVCNNRLMMHGRKGKVISGLQRDIRVIQSQRLKSGFGSTS